MAKPSTERRNETAQEEFQRRIRELYELAEKMNLSMTIRVKRKNPFVTDEMKQKWRKDSLLPTLELQSKVKYGPREPGEE